jgi:NAD(P)-dependent dehydrogenase (short-subunit alcohol dehydrogenase family)
MPERSAAARTHDRHVRHNSWVSIWMITGASRGLGASLVDAALSAGHRVVATARRPDEVIERFGRRSDVLPVELDVTDVGQAASALAVAVAEFGGIDVVVNSAGASFKGFFEEMTPAQVERQLAVNLVGPMNVTRAVLPVMRRQRSGLVVAVSSGAALIGFAYSSVYAASKAGLEGWMSALAQEVEPFGVRTMVVNPGFFRTGLASPESLVWPDVVVADYAAQSAQQRAWWMAQDGRQPGDPDKLARAIVALADEDPPPARFLAGADVIALAERKIAELRRQIESHRSLSMSLEIDL